MRRLLLAALLASCATARRPETIEQHEVEAQREAREAEEHERRAREAPPSVGIVSRPLGGEPGDGRPTGVSNPRETELAQARIHREHAEQHERAAQQLAAFEDAECEAVPRGVRAGCPLLPVISIDDVAGGVRLHLRRGANVRVIASRMRCHVAFARVHGDEVAACPLYVAGVRIEVESRTTILMLGTPAQQDEIRRRIRLQYPPSAPIPGT